MSAKSYAAAAPLHMACGQKHYPVDLCDSGSQEKRKCMFSKCAGQTFNTAGAYGRHLWETHSILTEDSMERYKWPRARGHRA